MGKCARPPLHECVRAWKVPAWKWCDMCEARGVVLLRRGTGPSPVGVRLVQVGRALVSVHSPRPGMVLPLHVAGVPV